MGLWRDDACHLSPPPGPRDTIKYSPQPHPYPNLVTEMSSLSVPGQILISKKRHNEVLTPQYLRKYPNMTGVLRKRQPP